MPRHLQLGRDIRKSGGRTSLKGQRQLRRRGQNPLALETGHAIIRVGDESLAVLIQPDGVQRANRNALSAANAYFLVNALYHPPPPLLFNGRYIIGNDIVP